MNTRVPKQPPPHYAEGFGDRLAQARTDMGLTQEELSALTCPEESDVPLVPARTISYWESGHGYPNLGPPIRALGKALGYESLAWLLRGDESGRRAGSRSDDPRCYA